MNEDFIKKLYAAHQACPTCPDPGDVVQFFKDVLGILFPETTKLSHLSEAQFKDRVARLQDTLADLVMYCVSSEACRKSLAADFFAEIPSLYDRLMEDVQAVYAGDPAATNTSEVIRSYPGFYAIAAYRFAHQLLSQRVTSIPRILTEHAHDVTGIDIHPGARIGHSFCIDHGTGVVIGETSIIGDHVKVYQGVTLGALSVNKSDAKTKRHPTIEDNVVIYAGATILGGETVIGHHSIVGGNVWLTRSIPPHSKVYYQSKMYLADQDVTDLLIIKES